MAVDITINETIDNVDITVNPNIIEVNVTRTTGGGGGVQSVTGTTVDNTDPLNPIVGVPTLQQVTDAGISTTNPIVSEQGLQGSEVNATDGTAIISLKPGTIGVGFNNGVEEGLLSANGLDGNYTWALPNQNGTIALTSDIPIGGGTVTSVGLSMPSAFTVTNSPITSSGDIAVTGAGAVSQYVRGDGTLANFPTSSGGGSSLSFYLNGSVSQGTFGGVAFREMDRTPILGAGTDFTINANGYIQSFITDAGVPNLLEIPAGNWNFETYFSASSGGGSPSFYVELYKWNSATLSLIASNSATPEAITGGTSIDLYISALAVPQTTLLATDRLAVRIYVTHSGRTITLHTEDNHLCQVITTFSTGLTALNGLTAQVQNLAVGTTGTNFGIVSSGSTHTFNLPNASAENRGALTSADWIAFSNRKRQIVNDTTSVTTTGVTVATLIKTYEITTGTLPTSGFLDIFMYLTRSNSTSGGYSLSISVNSVNNFATSTSIAGLTASGNFIQTLPIKAKLVLKSGTVTGAIVSQTTGDNYANMTSVPTPVTCNNTAGSVWFFVYVTPVSSSQSWTLQGVEITI